jgi:vancomycin permeability regulator SanA
MILFKFAFKLLAFVIALIIAIPVLSAARVWWSGTHPARGDATYAVVLGAAQLNGRPGEVLGARLEKARELYKAGRVKKIITVGYSQPGDRTTEAKAGAAWLRARGVQRNHVIIVNTGMDTYTSTVAYAKRITKISGENAPIFVVTDPWHCLRSVTMARDFHLHANCVPVDQGPNKLGNASSRYLMREMGAYLAYITLGRRGIHLSDHTIQSSAAGVHD